MKLSKYQTHNIEIEFLCSQKLEKKTLRKQAIGGGNSDITRAIKHNKNHLDNIYWYEQLGS